MLTFDAANRLITAISGTVTSNFAYNGDGARVKRTDGTTTTYYVGNHYEVGVTGGVTTTTKYYYFGSQRVAMKQGSNVTYLHSDHLGSTSATSGAITSSQVYFPFGKVRDGTGTLPTDFTFTGQKLDLSDGLMYYGAHYYDAQLGRFISADTIVPSAGNPQSLNRYSYVLNNPVRLTDPSGHWPPQLDNIIRLGRETVALAVTTGAEILHEFVYKPVDTIKNNHPEINNASNVVIDAVANGVESVRNKNPNTQGWGDLLVDWVFELGPEPASFGPEARTTKDLAHQNGLNDARQTALGKLRNGDLSSTPFHSTYGQDEFYQGLRGNVATSFLGSYDGVVQVIQNDDGTVSLEFTVKNDTSRESATRLRKAEKPGGDHRGIVPNVKRNEGIHLGENMHEQWQWTEDIPFLP